MTHIEWFWLNSGVYIFSHYNCVFKMIFKICFWPFRNHIISEDLIFRSTDVDNLRETGRGRESIIIVREIAVFLSLGALWGKMMLTSNLGVLFQCNCAEPPEGIDILVGEPWRQETSFVTLWRWS